MSAAAAVHRPTPQQWEVIRRTGEHLLVAAGAGTGKTTTVINRILYQLGVPVAGESCAQPLELRDIAAITFTNAAAADLKAKLRAGLRAAGRRDLAYEVDGARIGTIHGFCGELLREFALRTGRSPSMRVLEEGEASALVADAVHETILSAVESRSVAGLDELFALYELRHVEEWLARLVGESARLERIAQSETEHSGLERTVLELALLARDAVARRLNQVGGVDFDRMIVWTRDLLREPLVLRAVRSRLRLLVIDEFQDVDPIQKEIAWLIGDPESRRADTTRLVLVGDPKQSIYRFRRADVTVWREVGEAFERGLGAVAPLDENFRSVEPVLAFVDAAIGPILSQPIDGETLASYEVPFRPVTPTRGAPADEPRVEVIAVAPPEVGGVAAVRAAEAEAVARRARELEQDGVPWAHMAVLLSSWSALETYEGALRAAGIPTYALRLEGFYGRREVLDLILALEALRDPRDDRALLGFLRSPFVGLRDETLLAIALGARPPYWAHLGEVATGEAELLAWGRELLREHVPLRDRVPVHELLARLLDRSGYVGHLQALGPAGAQAIANVRKFLRIARQSRELGVGDFLCGIRELRRRDDRVGDERLYGPSENVVTISSIHSAKGLEWPVVFWCDLVRGSPSVSGNLLVGRDRIALKDPEAKEQSEVWRRLVAEEKAEEAAEDKRLWYVAATRARDRLILSGITVGQERDAGGEILRALNGPELSDGGRIRYRGRDGRVFEALVRLAEAEEADEDVNGAGAPAEPPPLEPDRLEVPPPPVPAPVGRARHSASSLMVHSRCARRHWFRYVAGLREPPLVRDGPEFSGAVARGQIVHDVLEHLEEEAEFDELLEAAIGRWDPDAPAPDAEPGRAYRARLAREIEAVSEHPEYRALAERPGARRELAFVRLLGPEAFLEGKVDLVAPQGEGLAVLDVKTGDADPAVARKKAEGYALQRSVYAAALESLSGRPVIRFAFHFSMARSQIGGELSAGERAAAAAQVREVVGRVGTGEPALAVHPAECRFCGYRRKGWCDGVKE